MDKKIIWGVVVVIVVALLLQFGGKKEIDRSVVIGAPLGLSGDAAVFGMVEKNAIQMAVDELNEKGGLGGKKVNVIFEDTRSETKATLLAVSKLLNIDKADVIIGPTWLDTYPAALELVKTGNVLMITPSASASTLNGQSRHPNLYTTFFRTDFQTEAFAKKIGQLGTKRLAIVIQNDPFFIDVGETLKKNAEKFGFEVITTELVNYGNSDLRTVLTKLKVQNPDGVYLGLFDQKGLYNYLREAKNLLPEVQQYSIDMDAYLSDPDYNGLFENFVYGVNPEADSKEFKEKYQARFGEAPLYSAPNAYDAVMIYAKAVESEGLDKNLSDFLDNEEFETVSFGPSKFDGLGGLLSDKGLYIMRKVVNGKAVPLE
jgi:branched-chain amino acid transport system substrate-binding protein